jgi:penicillin-binding protein 2
MTSPRLRNRAELIPLLIVALLFSILAVRLFFLQVVRAQTYQRLSEENRIRMVPLDAPRGRILDRNGEVLVCNRPSYVISITPFELRDMDNTIQALSRFLEMEPEEITARVEESKTRRFEPVKIKRDVDFSTLVVIRENILDLPGVMYQVEPRREYLHDRLAAHLLGTVGEISPDELNKLGDGNYRHGALIGKGGVEKEYDENLRGIDGARCVEVSAVGRVIGDLSEGPGKEVTPGNDLILTIDRSLQAVAEEALSDSVAGALVALDPNNGEVLAMASRPTFDPNLFSSVIPESTWRALNEDPGHPLLNRAVQSAYPPGSIMKVITAAVGLETGIISQYTRFAPCTGAYKYGDRWFGCWQHWGHGSLNLVGAMAQSCDVYFYQLGERLGLDRWSELVAECGLGDLMGIDLVGEVKGLVPTREYFNSRYGSRNWGSGVILNLAIGQGENLMTPLQAAALMMAVANGGTIHQPYIAQEIRSVKGQSILMKPDGAKQLPFSAETIDIVRRSMRAVVHHPLGTGRLARVSGLEVAGKTGTAENPRGEDHAWFACFAPLENPRIAVAVVVEHGGHGGTAAAPIARRVVEAYLMRGGV